MKPHMTAVLIDSDPGSASRIAEALKGFEGGVQLLGVAGSLQEGMPVILADAPHIIILEVNDVERGSREIESLLSRSPSSTIFVTCRESSPAWILRLIRAGAGEYLTAPVSAGELVDAVRKVARQHALKSDQAGKRGEVISVYNPSGGVGTTTIAVNLAATLAGRGHHTALVDLNLFSGDVGAFLDLAPPYTLASVIPKMGEVDISFLRSIVVPHPSGVQVLDGPAELAEANRIRPELILEVLALLRGVFDFIILDTGGQPFGCNLAAFDQSDQVLFATLLNLPALRNAKRYLETLAGEGFGPERVSVVMNRQTSGDDIKLSDAEKVLRTGIRHLLPNCYAEARNSINKGVPLVQLYPKSPFTRAMDQLVGRLHPESGPSGRPAH
ncbi:AAA family ATPase [Geomonas sp. Red32]|uniref:AAA family ATPase n=1 Tax=Geomonas sp. Red32 TaxID=2912856 RepID=UPI00202CD805|nr:AAA family ATPase [Geomonas sp. Red32]MCM0083897.1 AAA family ATPase [Geomonas sp. Red32]